MSQIQFGEASAIGKVERQLIWWYYLEENRIAAITMGEKQYIAVLFWIEQTLDIYLSYNYLSWRTLDQITEIKVDLCLS